LDRVEQGGASLNALDATQLQSLRQLGGELQPRIHKLLEGRTNANRQQVVDRYAVVLHQSDLASVDMVRGKQLFSQHCAACHRVDGVGTAVGPDVSDSRTQLPMQLLASILDPNRAIDNNYFRITVRMTDGTIHDGIVVEESSQHLTLRNQTTPSLVLSKPEIDSVKSSGVSLMPEGIEAQIDEASMVDLEMMDAVLAALPATALTASCNEQPALWAASCNCSVLRAPMPRGGKLTTRMKLVSSRGFSNKRK
jgi:putative heme-binding domain-containing protein